MDKFEASYVETWKRWQAINRAGVHCLHGHRTERTAAVCAQGLNKPTPMPGTPQGAWDAAAGYHD